MSKKNTNQIWVSPSDDRWRVHKPGAQRDIAQTETKAKAVHIAEQVARNQDLDTKVQHKDGTISSESNTYPRERDPFPPRG